MKNSTISTGSGAATLRPPLPSDQSRVGSGGLLAGRKVHHRIDAQSVLLDAAAEMTQAFSGKVQERAVRERRVSVHSGIAGLPRELRQKAFHQCKAGKSKSARDEAEKDGEAVGSPEELGRRLLSRPERVRQLTQRLDDDPTAQYLALLEAVELLESGSLGQDPNGAAVTAAREALEEMFAERGERILADINTVDAAAHLPRDVAGRVREAYQDAVFGADNLNGTLRHLLDSVGDSGGRVQFREVHAALLQALGLDMAAVRPSTDKPRLQALISDLYHLEVIGTTVDGCDGLSRELTSRHGIAPFDGPSLASELVGLTSERWVDTDHFKRIATRCGVAEPLAAAVDFMTGVRDLLKQLPLKVFGTTDGRDALLVAAQRALDYAIDREEGLEQ